MLQYTTTNHSKLQMKDILNTARSKRDKEKISLFQHCLLDTDWFYIQISLHFALQCTKSHYNASSATAFIVTLLESNSDICNAIAVASFYTAILQAC